MKCNYCGMELSGEQTVCPNCGAPIQSQSVQQKTMQMNDVASAAKKQFSNGCQCSKTIYIILAIFLGAFGVHDFYAKYHVRGIIKIVLTLTYIGAYVSAIWAIVDAFKVRQTKDGKMFI